MLHRARLSRVDEDKGSAVVVLPGSSDQAIAESFARWLIQTLIRTTHSPSLSTREGGESWGTLIVRYLLQLKINLAQALGGDDGYHFELQMHAEGPNLVKATRSKVLAALAKDTSPVSAMTLRQFIQVEPSLRGKNREGGLSHAVDSSPRSSRARITQAFNEKSYVAQLQKQLGDCKDDDEEAIFFQSKDVRDDKRVASSESEADKIARYVAEIQQICRSSKGRDRFFQPAREQSMSIMVNYAGEEKPITAAEQIRRDELLARKLQTEELIKSSYHSKRR